MGGLWRPFRHRLDLLAAVLLTATAVASFAASDQLQILPASACVLGFCSLVSLRNWRPVPVAVAAGALIAVPHFVHQTAALTTNATFIPAWAAIFLFSYSLGSEAPGPLSLLGVAAILVGVNLVGSGFNPVPEMMAIGPYAGGLAVASRQRASAELELRARELEEERELFAAQSVRYERARIARELHDIVAHSVSLMVVQANAGERLAAIDPERAAEALASINEAARQAEEEINLLVELLADTSPAAPAAGLRIVGELVARAQASGLAISCQLSGDVDDLAERCAETAYRMVQEGITNAIKHAAGAAIEVGVCGRDDKVVVRVANHRVRSDRSGLERSGGGHGLAGMRERVAQCGGTFRAGPTLAGGWALEACLPRHDRAGVATTFLEGRGRR